MKKYLPVALALGFFVAGFSVFMQSKPSNKNPRVYKFVQKYSPYYLEKSFGGLEILSRTDKEFKLKPDNMELFHKFEELEKKWGKKHLYLGKEKLSIRGDNNKTIDSIKLNNSNEIKFVHKYYGI